MTDDREDIARQRYMIMNLVRLAGIAIVLGGIAFAEKASVEYARVFGGLIAFAGVAIFFFWPRMLGRGWKSDDQ